MTNWSMWTGFIFISVRKCGERSVRGWMIYIRCEGYSHKWCHRFIFKMLKMKSKIDALVMLICGSIMLILSLISYWYICLDELLLWTLGYSTSKMIMYHLWHLLSQTFNPPIYHCWYRDVHIGGHVIELSPNGMTIRVSELIPIL